MDQIHPKQGLRGLIDVVDALKVEASQELTSLGQEVEDLRGQVDTREKALKQLENENRDLREQHERVYQTLVSSHHKSCTELEKAQGDLVNEISALKEDARKHENLRKGIEDREVQMQAEIAKFKEAARRSDESCKESIQRTEKLERDLKEATRDNDRLSDELRRSQDKITELSNANVLLEEKHTSVYQSLESTEKALMALRSSAAELKKEDVAVTITRLEHLWQSASSFINKHFRSKLPPTAFTDYELWRRLKGVVNHSVPLPRSDSVAAQDMRCAVILAFLIQLIDEEIFHPNYLAHERINIRRELLLQAVQDSRKEAFRRAMLISICAQEQAQILQDRVANVAASFMSFVKGLVEEDQIETLNSDAKAFTNLASEVWQRIQRLQERFEPNLEYTQDEGFDWQTIPLEGERSLKNDEITNALSDRVLLVIFPRIYIAKDAEPRPVTSGAVLWESQTVIAAQEIRDEGPSSPTFGRGYQNWGRTERARRESPLLNEPLNKANAAAFLGAGAPKKYPG